MNFKKSVNGSWVPINYNKNGTEIISTIAPIDFLSNGQNITVGLKGNTEQLEIPSPDNPVMPEGTGERTGNLLDIYANNTSNGYVNNTLLRRDGSTYSPSSAYISEYLPLEDNTTYTYYTGGRTGVAQAVCFYNAAKEYISGVPYDNQTAITFTTPQGTKYYRCTVMRTASDMESYKKAMLNTGSSPLPYEPFGVKIPISSASTTTPVYLGEVETERKVKKLVLDGNENVAYNARSDVAGRWVVTIPTANGTTKSENVISTHFKTAGSTQKPLTEGGICMRGTGVDVVVGGLYTDIGITAPSDSTTIVNAVKAYLTQQYAAGTPVTVWYVLAEPTTGVVNEPLMKIGNYADEVSNITVPTTKGSNTLSITTSVQPSNVQLSISGWVPHNNIKEYKNNAWMATSWEGFRDIVRAGNGPTRYPIGTKLYETWGDDTSNAWIIVDYDNSNYNDPDISALGYTHNVVLYEEKINYRRIFDNPEAWLYVKTAIPAGTYRFSIPDYDTSYGGGKTYIFTSTTDVPVGGQLTLTWNYQTNPTKVQAYSSSTSTTALFDVTITEWDTTTACVDLGTIKLAMSDPDSTYGKLNHIHRARYGSNNYYQSGIRQWLNADATANNWWKPTNIFDRPYGPRTTDGGLYLMDEDFRKVIAAPNITCITNNIFETGISGSTAFKLQTQYTIRDKIFLPTHTELNLSSNPNIGTVFSQYTNAGNDDRIKYRKDNGNVEYYWFRTSYPSNGNGVRCVISSGALNGLSAVSTIGAVRACIIQ